MSNLVPERRADKNGKMVLRHVKADAGAPSSAKQLPPPTASPAPINNIVLPQNGVTSMTKEDWATVAGVLDMCGTHQDVAVDMAQVVPYIRDGDMEAMRIFHKYSSDYSYPTIVDVIEAVNGLYGNDKPADYVEKVSAHMVIATSGYFDYFDIAGVPDNEAILKIIHENTQQVESILAFLMEREPDTEALESYLANQTTALRRGTL